VGSMDSGGGLAYWFATRCSWSCGRLEPGF